MDNRSQLVLFDVGGVLMELDYHSFYKKASKILGIAPEEFKKRFKNSEIEKQALKGILTKEELKEELRKLISKNEMSDLEISNLGALRFKGPILETINLKEQVYNSGSCVGLFSNMDDFGFDILNKRYPEMLKTYGGPKIYSYQIGDVKPNSPMYEEAQGLGFNKVTYIDDNEDYVRKALDFGWNPIFLTAFIDNVEAARLGKPKNNLQDNPKIKIANSVKELTFILRESGIKIT